MMADDGDLNATWVEVQDKLPGGWAIDSVRCASTSLAQEDRSNDWIAVATAGDGRRHEHRAAEPRMALLGLAADLASM